MKNINSLKISILALSMTVAASSVMALDWSSFFGPGSQNRQDPSQPSSDEPIEVRELRKLEERILQTNLSKEAHTKAVGEIKKLWMMNPMSPEAAEIRKYLDWLLSVPWDAEEETIDLAFAEKVLDEDHYGLEKVKERILEHLAVVKKVGAAKAPILCFVGPPGVGKTSIGKSIARAVGRKYLKVALGGVRDESIIRGHMRMYIGSRPGKIISQLKKAGVTNPIMLLDEIDKVGGSNHEGDPQSALLEVLDPEQNSEFNDHYLDVGYDLSNVIFIATANSLDMPKPLLDRLEIIELSGYTEQEKLEISKNHLLPKLLKNHGLKRTELTIDDEVIRILVNNYTREAGVRNLERELAGICRKVTRQISEKNVQFVRVTTHNLEDYAGIPKFIDDGANKINRVGVTNGMAATGLGGFVINIEAVKMAGEGKIITTGKLGDVMKESISAASSLIRSRTQAFGIDPKTFKQFDIHVHVPDAAQPKEGPSAGAAMVTSIISVLTNNPVRADVAMTGEINLTGKVKAIGGLKEKLLAAHRDGIKTVIIPKSNAKDLKEIDDQYKKQFTIVMVDNIDDVLKIALTKPIKAL